MVNFKSFRSRRGKIIMRFSRNYDYCDDCNFKYRLYLSDEKINGKYTARIVKLFGENLLLMDYQHDVQMTEKQVKHFLKIIEEGKRTYIPYNLKEDDVLVGE